MLEFAVQPLRFSCPRGGRVRLLYSRNKRESATKFSFVYLFSRTGLAPTDFNPNAEYLAHDEVAKALFPPLARLNISQRATGQFGP